LLTTITLATLNLEIDGVALPLTNKSVTFAQALDENTSYTVVVDVRANRWAWSNIYWDATLNDGDGAMTFDRTLVDLSHQYYHGIFFKWGSLVGRWAPQASGLDASYLYIPNDVVTKTWVGPKNISETIWASFTDIPYNGDYVSTTGSYLYQHPNYSSYLGDICSYIDDDWRLPNILEMTVTTPEMGAIATDYSWVSGSVASSNLDGTGMITSGGEHRGSSGFVFFPAPGGVMTYLTGSPTTEVNNSYCFWHLSGNSLNPQYYNVFMISDFAPRFTTYSVRCIKKLATD
jgi:hypothetical protein